MSYWPNGAIAQFTYGNGIVHTLTQNTRGLPDRSRDADGSTSIHDDSYAYDQNGNVAAISDGVAGARATATWPAGTGFSFGLVGLTPWGAPGSVAYGAASLVMETPLGKNFKAKIVDGMCYASTGC